MGYLSDRNTKSTLVDADDILVRDSGQQQVGPDGVTRNVTKWVPLSGLIVWLLAKILRWFGVVVGTAEGMVADLLTGTASITSGETTATFSGITITTAHVGKTVVVRNAGGASTPLVATIVARLSASSATLSVAASATVSGERCSVGTNNATALQTACTAAGGRTLVIPPGDYLIAATVATVAKDAGIVTVPSRTTILGFPRESRLHFLGTVNTAGSTNYYHHLFRVADASRAVRFLGLHFTADNGSDGTGFTYVQNNQSSAIDVQANATKDVWVVGCTFDDLWGFTAHDRGADERVHFILNTSRNCANGVNINAYYSLQLFNYFENSEAIEAAGAYSLIAGNLVVGAQGSAIGVGGNTGVGARRPMMFVVGNIVRGGTGLGVSSGEAFVESVIAFNLIRECATGGIYTLNPTVGTLNERNLILGNILVGNCTSGGGNVVGMMLGGTGSHFAVGNFIYDGAVSGFAQLYPLAVTSPNCMIVANYCSNTGTNHNISVQSGATNTILAANYLAQRTMEVTGTGTIGRRLETLKAASDVVDGTRVTGESTVAGHERWLRKADGTFEWGDGNLVTDTNLYRSAANVLKTDDRLIAAGGLVTTAAVTGSRPSGPTQGQVHFDTTLGIPIWYSGSNWVDATGTTV